MFYINIKVDSLNLDYLCKSRTRQKKHFALLGVRVVGLFVWCKFYFCFFCYESTSQGAPARLPADKAATRQDAEGVMEAEIRNNPSLTAYPGGVAASVAAAARLNERTA